MAMLTYTDDGLNVKIFNDFGAHFERPQNGKLVLVSHKTSNLDLFAMHLEFGPSHFLFFSIYFLFLNF